MPCLQLRIELLIFSTFISFIALCWVLTIAKILYKLKLRAAQVNWYKHKDLATQLFSKIITGGSTLGPIATQPFAFTKIIIPRMEFPLMNETSNPFRNLNFSWQLWCYCTNRHILSHRSLLQRIESWNDNTIYVFCPLFIILYIPFAYTIYFFHIAEHTILISSCKFTC